VEIPFLKATFHNNLIHHLRTTKIDNFEKYDREYYQQFDDNKLKRFIFDNYRISGETEKGLRLCYAGFDILKEYYDYREVSISKDNNHHFSSKLLLELDIFMKMPYLIKKNHLILFDIPMAFEVMIFGDFITYKNTFDNPKKLY
jgi:hypothetical protein